MFSPLRMFFGCAGVNDDVIYKNPAFGAHQIFQTETHEPLKTCSAITKGRNSCDGIHNALMALCRQFSL
jgi:hypothetical protein